MRGDDSAEAPTHAARVAFAADTLAALAQPEGIVEPQLPAAAIAAWSLVHRLSHLIFVGAPSKSEAEAFKRAILAPSAGEVRVDNAALTWHYSRDDRPSRRADYDRLPRDGGITRVRTSGTATRP